MDETVLEEIRNHLTWLEECKGHTEEEVRDGRFHAVTRDYNQNRVNVHIVERLVTKADTG